MGFLGRYWVAVELGKHDSFFIVTFRFGGLVLGMSGCSLKRHETYTYVLIFD